MKSPRLVRLVKLEMASGMLPDSLLFDKSRVVIDVKGANGKEMVPVRSLLLQSKEISIVMLAIAENGKLPEK